MTANIEENRQVTDKDVQLLKQAAYGCLPTPVDRLALCDSVGAAKKAVSMAHEMLGDIETAICMAERECFRETVEEYLEPWFFDRMKANAPAVLVILGLDWSGPA